MPMSYIEQLLISDIMIYYIPLFTYIVIGIIYWKMGIGLMTTLSVFLIATVVGLGIAELMFKILRSLNPHIIYD